MSAHQPQIVVLARCPPEEDEAAVASALRARYPALGVVLLAATADVGAQVRALVLGADACLCEPVEPSMLVATLHSLARRLQSSARAGQIPAVVLEAGGWRLLGGGWRLSAPDGQTVALTKSERPLLSRLLQQPGELVLREQLIAVLTSDVFEFDTHRLDSLIHRLRRKVAHQCAHPLPLSAVHGEGYVFVV
ncbi:winged helix-turn-helix domain-containing protein [Stenotrophomonas sp. C3(2023)]|nr:winged helix-turn-helix domain-containing protein [Stenotrophomonas sp. C3(2023)]MDV3469361.1 winged helix-turn-helix domain-containing protein [Stenotrophomonas sp. C3(2023)]